MVAPFSKFYGKIWVGFCLGSFILKPTERAYVPLENGTRDFQNSTPCERSLYFFVIISWNFERFQWFNFETNFLENKNLFQEIGVGLPFFSWKY